MRSILITNATLINEGRRLETDVLVRNGRIERIAPRISMAHVDEVYDACGLLLMPGLIDDQVHFREPGLVHKADIASESRAAVVGGVTTFMEMPNTTPATTTLELLEQKFAIAARTSAANHSFFLGATNTNIETVRALDPRACCGVKVFMGSSTGDMLVDNAETLDKVFAASPTLIATHCEDTPTIKAAEDKARKRWGDDVPAAEHPNIRSREACIKSTKLALELAARHASSRLHILHISTAEELALFTDVDIDHKRVTAEACVHHLHFCADDYAALGHKIKCNPAIKTARDREALRLALATNRIDVIGTDHAPHLPAEKAQPYFKAPSGLPLVQHSLQMMLQMVHEGVMSLETLVQKACHNPAHLFQIRDRGFVREGYWADLVLVDYKRAQTVTAESLLYKCGWSPLEGHAFPSSVVATFVNGRLAARQGRIIEGTPGKRLDFDR